MAIDGIVCIEFASGTGARVGEFDKGCTVVDRESAPEDGFASACWALQLGWSAPPPCITANEEGLRV